MDWSCVLGLYCSAPHLALKSEHDPNTACNLGGPYPHKLVQHVDLETEGATPSRLTAGLAVPSLAPAPEPLTWEWTHADKPLI